MPPVLQAVSRWKRYLGALILFTAIFAGTFAKASFGAGDIFSDDWGTLYRIVSRLGGGGQAKVYIAEPLSPQANLPRSVAVRVGKATDADLNQLIVAMTRDSRNLVRVFRTIGNIEKGRTATILEVGDRTLQDVIKSDTRLSSKQSDEVIRERIELMYRILADITNGLSEMHRAGWVHLDVKDTNVIRVGASFKLIDFYFMREIGEHARARGTLGFVSPEQYALGRVSELTDFYSLGNVIFKMLTRTYVIDEFNDGTPPDERRESDIYSHRHDEMVVFAKEFLRKKLDSLNISSSDTKVKLDALADIAIALIQTSPSKRLTELRRVAEIYKNERIAFLDNILDDVKITRDRVRSGARGPFIRCDAIF